jgi:hypothetical protein
VCSRGAWTTCLQHAFNGSSQRFVRWIPPRFGNGSFPRHYPPRGVFPPGPTQSPKVQCFVADRGRTPYSNSFFSSIQVLGFLKSNGLRAASGTKTLIEFNPSMHPVCAKRGEFFARGTTRRACATGCGCIDAVCLRHLLFARSLRDSADRRRGFPTRKRGANERCACSAEGRARGIHGFVAFPPLRDRTSQRATIDGREDGAPGRLEREQQILRSADPMNNFVIHGISGFSG